MNNNACFGLNIFYTFSKFTHRLAECGEQLKRLKHRINNNIMPKDLSGTRKKKEELNIQNIDLQRS